MQHAIGASQPETGFVVSNSILRERIDSFYALDSVRILVSRRLERARFLSMVRGEIPRIFDQVSTGCFSSEVRDISSRSGSPRRTFRTEAGIFSAICLFTVTNDRSQYQAAQDLPKPSKSFGFVLRLEGVPRIAAISPFLLAHRR